MHRRRAETRHKHPLAMLPAAPATAGAAGKDEEAGAAMPHADLVRRAKGPRVQVMQGAPRGAALLLPAP